MKESRSDLAVKIAISLLMFLLEGWVFMFTVGFAQQVWVPALPTIGYWNAVLLVFLLRNVFVRTPLSGGKR